MKTLLTLLVASGLLAGAALAAPPTEKEQAVIKQEVAQTVQNLFAAFERADTDAILGFFSDAPAFLAVDAEGKVSDSPTFRKATREFFQMVSGEKINTKSQEIRVLGANNVGVVWHGDFRTMMKDGTVMKCDSYAATFLFKRTGNEWKIIYDHESGVPPQPVPPTAASKQLVTDAFAAMDRADYRGFRELVPDDAIIHIVGAPEPYKREALIAFLQDYWKAFPDTTHTIHEIVAEEDTVVAHVTCQGTHRGPYEGVAPTGRPIHYEGVHIVHIQQGRIRDWWVMDDSLGMMQQLGLHLSSAAPAGAE